MKDAAEEYLQAVDENAAEMPVEDVNAGIEGRKKQRKAIGKQVKKRTI